MQNCIVSLLGIVLGSFWGAQLGVQQSLPLGEVRITRGGRVGLEDRVPIWTYGGIYSALGMTSKNFTDWEVRYGMDSLGVGEDGELLIPGFPVFSKVAWTYIDPVDLSQSETAALIAECERAASKASGPSEQDTFRRIRDLALKAIEESAGIHFGPPYSR